ncbi:Enolase, C-terminal [Parasponia andersonii]|uniref:phosphopyruvate hydratase n=1 Tax=Parasponia andersonii TaxID=3476 RepID=A0A2P5CBV1_PARAD|nr:Enolase, C-terminal [Parasponia andersonii]
MARSFEDAIIVVKELYMRFKTKEALDLLVEVIDNAGYLGTVCIGLDFTASKLDIHEMLRKAIKGKVCNSLLLEVNELRCITECIEALELLRTAGWTLLMSGHNSCEMDTDIADLFVGFRPFVPGLQLRQWKYLFET